MRSAFAVLMLLGAVQATEAQTRWTLTLERRFVLDEGPAEPIKDLRDFAVGPDARLYVLENTVKQVHVYLPSGKYSRTFSRVGSGPGEIRAANGILAMPGGTLWVNDYGNRRFTIYSNDGVPLRHVRSSASGYGYTWSAFVDSARVLHDALIAARRGTFERRSLDGEIIDTLSATPCPDDQNSRKTSFRAQSKGASMGTSIRFVQRSLAQ